MHEMALAESMLEIVEAAARDNGSARVKGVWLEIGALSHVVPEALRFCFDAVTRGSVADGAALTIIETPGGAWCMQCSRTVPLAQLGDACPHCGGFQLTVTQGDAMRVKEIEIA